MEVLVHQTDKDMMDGTTERVIISRERQIPPTIQRNGPRLCNNSLCASLHICERGLSLISTLWLLTILSVLATHFLYSIRLEQRAQANFADRTKFHYTAKAGFERGGSDAARG